MGAAIDFISAAPARIASLFYGLVAAVAVIATVSCVALWYRGEAIKAEGERDLWKAQAGILASAAASCSAGVDQAKRAADAAVAATGELAAAARRLKQPQIASVERIETIIERHPTVEQAADCNWAQLQLEADYQKRKAGAP